jgi:catechol 2,3-dioxygenase-like lactoylglutathione lyase family enzyme
MARPALNASSPVKDRNMHLTGIHHLTAVTGDAPRNHDFYTRTLGMRLVKKTVNQDDTSAYHLFYADGEATPGSDITFFDWPVTGEKRGTTAARARERYQEVPASAPIALSTASRARSARSGAGRR